MLKSGLRAMGILATLVYAFCSFLLFAQGPDTLWARTYGGGSTDVGNSVQQTSDGGYIITGYTNSYGGGSIDVYLIKVNADGDTLWTATYGGSDGEAGECVQQTDDGGYIITGIDQYGEGSDVYLIKVNGNGDTLWTRTYGGSGAEGGRSVQQTTDGGYIIAGYTADSWGLSKVYLIKTDANGDTLWTKILGDSPYGDYSGRSVQQTTDSGYIIAGYTNVGGGGSYDVYLIKTDDRGALLWSKTYGETGSAYADFAHSVQQTIDGGYIIAAQTQSFGGAGSYDAGLIKTDGNGDLLWAKTYGSSGVELGSSVQQTTDGGYILVGQGFGDVYVVKTEPELAAFVVTPSNIDFGDVDIGSSKTDSVAVTNTGNGAILNIASVVSDNETFTVTPTTGSLNPAQSMHFYITFAPVDSGVETGNIIFTHNAPTSPDTVAVAGNGVVGIAETKTNSIPVVYTLSQGYPNPFKVKTRIHYQLPRQDFVTIAIYNVSGQRIKILVDGSKKPGYHTAVWNGQDETNQIVSSGVYFCQMKVGLYSAVKKIIMMD